MRKGVLILFCLILSLQLNAQGKAVLKANVQPKTINISCEHLIKNDNVVLIIYDSLHKILFLENRHHLNNEYRKSLDISSWSKGKYYVQIKSEQGLLNKEIRVK
jgi:hypothetical protein